MLKDRKKPTDYRYGKLVKLVDLMQRFSKIHHEDDYYLDNDGDLSFNPKYAEELEDMMRELRHFDITEIGNLYLTSGGRVVLDKGYGEYFGDSDKVVCTLSDLTIGMNYKAFLKRLQEVIDDAK